MQHLTTAKARFQPLLDEAASNSNAEQKEQTTNNEQNYELNVQYYKFMSACKRVLAELTFTRICAVVKVRNEVMSHSETIDITDCDFTYWVPSDRSVLCDDSCPSICGPDDNSYKCGGSQLHGRLLERKMSMA